MTPKWPESGIHMWGRGCGKGQRSGGQRVLLCERSVNGLGMSTDRPSFTGLSATGYPPADIGSDLHKETISTESTDATTTTTLIYFDNHRGSHRRRTVWTANRVVPLTVRCTLRRGKIQFHGYRVRKGPT